MSDGIYAALSGAIAQERALNAVANNVANVNTTGFKADKTVFAEVMNEVKNERKIGPSLRYSTVNQFAVDPQPGSLKLTGRPFDVALHGDGYFTVRTPLGERYTRDGSFVLDADGILRTSGGYEVLQESVMDAASTNDPTKLPEGQPIFVPIDSRDVQINQNGVIAIDGQPVGRLKLVRFDSQEDALREGLTLFTHQENREPFRVHPSTTVEQGYLESANVNAVSGMNELISVSRHFEALEKVIETFRQLDDRTARDVGGRA
ncbi:MAG: flagellar basal-body rod protein FlgF [Polyangiales bacterium]